MDTYLESHKLMILVTGEKKDLLKEFFVTAI